LRPPNAGSNTAEDHFTVLGLALAQLPAQDLAREILVRVRADISGQRYQFTALYREAKILFSVGYELIEAVRAAIVKLPESEWVRAINAEGAERPAPGSPSSPAGSISPRGPEGSRLICRSERPAHLDEADLPARRLPALKPARLRQRVPHIAAQVVRHGRRTHLKIDRAWPWSDVLAAAFQRMRPLPGLY
jgi:hypothetical protein